MIYNVLIGGFSIGLTRRKDEAEEWVALSGYHGKKKIVVMAA